MNRIRFATAAVLAGGLVIGAGATGAVAGQLITGRDVANGSLAGRDLGSDTISRRHLRPGVDQLLSDAGVRVVSQARIFDPGVEKQSVACPGQGLAVGGGVRVDAGGPAAVRAFSVAGSYPEASAPGVWSVDAVVDGAEPVSATVFAVCQ